MAVDRKSAFRTVVLALVWALVCVAVAFVLAVVAPKPSHAQGGEFLWNTRESSAPYGDTIWMWNATGSQINKGVIVMTDTTSSTSFAQIAYGKGFKTFSGSTTDVRRIVGVLVDDCAGNGYARIMRQGFFNRALMGATAIAAGTYLEPGLTAGTAGAFVAWSVADTTNTAKPVVGRLQRYTTTSELYGWVYVNFYGSLGGK